MNKAGDWEFIYSEIDITTLKKHLELFFLLSFHPVSKTLAAEKGGAFNTEARVGAELGFPFFRTVVRLTPYFTLAKTQFFRSYTSSSTEFIKNVQRICIISEFIRRVQYAVPHHPCPAIRLVCHKRGKLPWHPKY
jgi:hypothetical protein